MHFRAVQLRAPARLLTALRDFYVGLGIAERDETLTVGESGLEFVAGEGEPFYHFALLAPGERFDELLAWARGRVELLPDPETGGAVFDFSNWDASACYFHDPAGNIVELIAHRGIGDAGTEGPFRAEELLGLSELGLVGDTTAMARRLQEKLGLDLWDGTLEEGRLAFLGERARTLILGPPGRGWLPTGRPAELHPIEVELSGPTAGVVELEGGLYRISSR